MMKNMKKIIALILCVACFLSLALIGCKNQKELVETQGSTEQTEPVLENTGIDMETAIPVLTKPEKTAFHFIEEGKSTYKIVLPAESTEMLDLAAEELQYFIKEATGVTLEVVADAEFTGKENVISLGKTTVAKQLGVAATKEDDLGTSGYIIKTVGSSVAIVDDVEGDGEGVLYGVYDFLLDAIDLKVYAADEITYAEVDTVPLYAYDATVKPSFDERSLSYYDLIMDQKYMHRMRMFDFYSTEKIALFGHSQITHIMPFTEEHAQWYCPGGGQLCWAAGPEMEQAFAERLIARIQEFPNAQYFMLGQEDTTNLCSCDKCLAAVSDDMYGSYTGLQVAFLNNVIELVEAWREENMPERELGYICFAYQISLLPPVKEDANGNLVAYHEDCMPADELYVLIAPIEADYSEELKSDANKRTYNAVIGWEQLVGDRLWVYEYDTNYKTYLTNFDNFEVVQEHFQTYYDHGVKLMYSQGPVNTYIPCFTEMRIFVESQLMWDLEKNYNDLVNEFMAVYYKDAAPAMRKYYDFIRMNYAEQENGGTGRIYALLDQPDYYSYEDMEQMDAYLEEALSAIEHLRNTDNELFATLYYRIKKENISTLWLKLHTFSLYYDDDEIEKYALEFYYLWDKYGFEQYAEGQDLSDMFYGFIREQ